MTITEIQLLGSIADVELLELFNPDPLLHLTMCLLTVKSGASDIHFGTGSEVM